jgi:CelD/BcsL family acetyltransferase involved in cellulose biosynthesis
VLSLSERGDGVEEWLTPRMRTNLRYARRRLAREGGQFETADAGTLVETLDALFRLHAARWNGRHLPGAFAGRRTREFHRETAAALLSRGWLRLYGLRQEDRLRAVLYCFLCGGRGYYYSGGFDPEVARLSPGTLLTAHAVDDALRAGAAAFDFLRGDEPYKYAWGAVDTLNTRVLLWRRDSLGSLARWAVRGERRVEGSLKRVAAHLSRPRGGRCG